MATRKPQALAARVDREVYPVVRKYFDEVGSSGTVHTWTSVSVLYEHIRNSNSSLARLKKNTLEASLERVIEVVKDDEANVDSDDHMVEGAVSPVGDSDRPSRAMNRTITNAFANGAVKADQDPNPERKSKRRKRRAPEAATDDWSSPSHVSLSDMGGVDQAIDQLFKLVVAPIRLPDLYPSYKTSPPGGILLYGPPGCGKTMLVNALAAELKTPFISISAPSIVSGMSGESEKALREHFQTAVQMAPCIMFIDEIDAIVPKRENAQREMEKRIVSQLLTCMDSVSPEKTNGKPVIVLAATNRPDSIDPALRRGGRFDKEIAMPIPNEPGRRSILRVLASGMPISDDVDFSELAKKTSGFVGADLNDLVKTAASIAIDEVLRKLHSEASALSVPRENDASVSRAAVRVAKFLKYTDTNSSGRQDNPTITYQHFLNALPEVQPMAKREGFTTVPATTWDDVGGFDYVRKALTANIIQPILEPETWEQIGVTPPSGILLWGPPGCGKTHIAKAAANQSQANFIYIKGPELLSKYLGDSERKVRELFARARSSAPCIIFFDELDALVPKRDDGLNEGSSRVVNTLLVELDGIESREGIFIIGATNRPDRIDDAMLRPGRLEELVFVDLPSEADRVEILKTAIRSVKIEPTSTWLASLAKSCDGFSGADLSTIVRKAATRAIERKDQIREGDIWEARKDVSASVANYAKYKELEKIIRKE